MKATACGRKWSKPPPPRASPSSSAWIPASAPPKWCAAPLNFPSMSSSPTITCPTRICPPPSPSSTPIAPTAPIPKKISAAPAWHSNRSEERRVGKSVDLGGRRIIKKKKKKKNHNVKHRDHHGDAAPPSDKDASHH